MVGIRQMEAVFNPNLSTDAIARELEKVASFTDEIVRGNQPKG